MTFGKTFLLSFVTLVAINFGGWVLYLALSGAIGQFVTQLGSLEGIAHAFFFPKKYIEYPGNTFYWLVLSFSSDPIPADLIVYLIFLIAAPLLAAIVAGIVGENKMEVFGAWMLVIGVCMGVALTLILIDQPQTPAFIANFVLGAFAHGLLYGCVALLVEKSESF